MLSARSGTSDGYQWTIDGNRLYGHMTREPSAGERHTMGEDSSIAATRQDLANDTQQMSFVLECTLVSCSLPKRSTKQSLCG